MDARNSNHLIIRDHQSRGESGLPNQGQIDWVALANTTVSASVGLLSRMSGAGVDPFTIAVGQAVASKFQMSRLGVHRLETAIKNLRHESLMGEMLWFGFGIKHIVRSLMQTTEGATCVMLCSILSETRTTILAARVMYELTTTYSSTSPEAVQLTPSLQQWKALVEASAGCLSLTPFGTIVDQMVTLLSQHRTSSTKGGHRRHVGNPKDVASVLNALGRLSSGQIVTLTISGGCDCGWIAAVAYWFFDIAVQFRDASGQTIYPLGKQPNASRRTLVVIQASESSTALQAIGEAYTVADITLDIIARDQDSGELSSNVNDLQTRVPWQSVLRQTFGRQASILLRLKVDLGTAIGSASRMFLEYANPTIEISVFLTSSGWYGHGAASYGPGFLDFTCSTFPEIASLRENMETASQVSFSDAVAAYQRTQERIRSTCGCHLCKEGVKKPTDPGVRGKNLCLVQLCGFVIQLALILSITSTPPSLLPTRSGLEELYGEFSTTEYQHSGPEFEYLVSISYMNAWSSMSVLFTGFKNFREPRSETLAYVTNGLCSYRGVLHKLSDEPGEMLRIFTIPGCIETRTGRLYDSLHSTTQFDTPLFNFDAAPARPCVTIPPVPRSFEGKYEVNAVVEETLLSLTTHFIVKKSPNESVVCSPSMVTSALQLACANRVLCPRQDCSEIDIADLSVVTIQGEGAYKDQSLSATREVSKIGLRLVNSDPVARLMALLVDKFYVSRPPNAADLPPYELPSDGWLDYGDPDLSPASGGREEFRTENTQNQLFDTQQEVEERSLPIDPPHELDAGVLLQRDECLPCTIREAVAMRAKRGHNVYIVCK